MPAKKTAAAKSSKTAPRASSRSQRRPAKTAAGDAEVSIDRRRTGRREEGTTAAAAPAPALERRKKVQRRRQIDPTTCERDYSIEEVEFMNAMDEYKRKSGRMFPTCSEVLEVIRNLGYVKLSLSERTLLGLESAPTTEERLDAVTDVVDALVDETL
jgi:hypothetical protein